MHGRVIPSSISQCKQLHARLLVSGDVHQPVNVVEFISIFINQGFSAYSHLILDHVEPVSLFSYNGLIKELNGAGYLLESMRLYRRMRASIKKPDAYTFSVLARSCETLVHGEQVHCELIKFGFGSDMSVGASTVSMHVRLGCLNHARKVLDEMRNRDPKSWNLMIIEYARNGCYKTSLDMFWRMTEAGMESTKVAMAKVLQACSCLRDLEQGRAVHDYIVTSGFEVDDFVETAILDMYMKCGAVDVSVRLFEEMLKKDVVSWNVVLAGCANGGLYHDVLNLFQRMRKGTDLKPNEATLIAILPALSELKNLLAVMSLHCYSIKAGLNAYVNVSNSFVSVYGKCGSVDSSRLLFETMQTNSVVSWNSIIVTCEQNGFSEDAINLFIMMRRDDTVPPDFVTVVSILQACALMAVPRLSSTIHGYVIRDGFAADILVSTALIEAYAKSGRLHLSQSVFNQITDPDLVAWTSMLSAYAIHGCGTKSVHLFEEMLSAGIRPDHVCFTHVLAACSHSGLVEVGKQYFYQMSADYGIEPRVDHYSCMVDLLGRSGFLSEAHQLIKSMPFEPNASVWGALLGACRIHHDIELGRLAAGKLFMLDPLDPGNYIILSNIYSAAGQWHEASKVRALMKEKGLRKNPGYSFIESNNKLHVFSVGDQSHPESAKIYAKLEAVTRKMIQAGYMPKTEFVLHDIDEELKVDMLHSHSEKLAIAYGLLTTTAGAPILITKNLRICGDCHTAAKFISMLENCVIIVRDCKRFHHFEEGSCSCGDYW